jgi:hypothetical protein
MLGRVGRPSSTGVISIPVPFDSSSAADDAVAIDAVPIEAIPDEEHAEPPARAPGERMPAAEELTPPAIDVRPAVETGRRDPDATAWWAPRSPDQGEPTGSGGAPGIRSPTHAAPVKPSRFLRFSTGETVAVTGTGLIGRRPLPQPGEYVDQLVRLDDRTLSVSKTHLEFGLHGADLWIADRFSGNGTIVRRPDEAAVRCEPGRRYLVPTGSRVELAEQYFLVD